eukprot:g779.t1
MNSHILRTPVSYLAILPSTQLRLRSLTSRPISAFRYPYLIWRPPCVSKPVHYSILSFTQKALRNAELWWEKDQDFWVDVSSPESLTEALKCSEHELAVVDWYATWCHGCRKTSPLLTELASDFQLNQRVKFVRVCVDSMAAHARKQGVKALPYLTIHDGSGETLIGFGAAASKVKTFRKNIETVLENRDMDYQLDPNGLVIPLEKITPKSRTRSQEAEIEELRRFSASLSGRLNKPKEEEKEDSLDPVQTNGDDGLITERQAFLDDYGQLYGYNGLLNSIYDKELGNRLGQNQYYLDYTGSSVYIQSQLSAIMNEFQNSIFGNPHSENPSSALTRERIEEVRQMILEFFDADPRDYQVIFTTSATAALKLLAETYPWTENSTFRYLRENHNSVLGMREYVLREGGGFESVAEETVEDWLQTPATPSGNGLTSPVYNLFSYPAEDNFAGVKYPLTWIHQIQQKSTEQEIWKVALDAAAFVGTQPLSLRQYPADYVSISFYKMFGYPTGLGALIAKVDGIEILDKVFWAGGSVALATSKDDFHVLKCRPTERLEDGTVAFLDIISLKHGFETLKRFGGMMRIQQHVTSLTEWLYRRLNSLQHSNGRPLVKIFGKHGAPNSRDVQGGILNFELLGPNGKVLSYKSFELEAAKSGFHIRTGIECNPGAAYNYIGIQESEVESLAGLTEGCDDEMEYIQVSRPRAISLFTSVDSSELSSQLQMDEAVDLTDARLVSIPLGSVRISLGYMSTFEDCLRFVQFLERSCKDRDPESSKTIPNEN